jgi:hypothetical protein
MSSNIINAVLIIPLEVILPLVLQFCNNFSKKNYLDSKNMPYSPNKSGKKDTLRGFSPLSIVIANFFNTFIF